MAFAFSSRMVQRASIPFVAFLLALIVFHASPGEALLGDDPLEVRVPIVVGPFKLGDWLDASKVEFRAHSDFLVLDKKEKIKSLKKCPAYVYDKKIVVKEKSPRFGSQKFVVSGELHHVFEKKNGRFVIQIATMTASPNMTDYSAKP